MNVSIIRIPSRLTLHPLVSLHVGFPTTLNDGEYMSNPAERQLGGNLCGSPVVKDVADTVGLMMCIYRSAKRHFRRRRLNIAILAPHINTNDIARWEVILRWTRTRHPPYILRKCAVGVERNDRSLRKCIWGG